MNYFQFHVGDYIKSTLHLTLLEDLAYRRLLDLYYDTESPIPNDIPALSRRLRMGKEEIEIVLNEFFSLTTEGWRNTRADAEIESYHDYLDKQRSNGKLGGRPKKTHRLPTVNPMGNPDVTQKKPNQEPLTINHKPERERSPNGSRLPLDWSLPEEWESFCQAERPDLSPREVAMRFADYWHGVAGAKGRKADWLATWRNWVRAEKRAPGAVQQMTVPAREIPPAVQVSDEHKARCTPMPAELREKIASLTRGM